MGQQTWPLWARKRPSMGLRMRFSR